MKSLLPDRHTDEDWEIWLDIARRAGQGLSDSPFYSMTRADRRDAELMRRAQSYRYDIPCIGPEWLASASDGQTILVRGGPLRGVPA